MSQHIAVRFGIFEISVLRLQMVENDGLNDGKCSIGGRLGSAVTKFLIDPWLALGHNCTMNKYVTYGNFEDGTGLKGSMARGENDFVPMTTMMYEYPGVEYSVPMYSDNLVMASAYNYSENITETDLLHSFASFQSSYYIAILMSSIFFSLAWRFCCSISGKMSKIHRKQIRRAHKSSSWIVICALLDQDLYPQISKAVFTILSMSITLLYFLLINCFMLNMMSTDLVVIVEPRVVKSYADIVHRDDVRVFFSPGMNEEIFFKNAEPGSDEAQIWKNRIKVKSASIGSVVNAVQPVVQQRAVGIAREWMINAIAHTGLKYMRSSKMLDVRAYVVKDKTEKQISNGFMIAKNANPILKEYVYKRSLKLSQSGIFVYKVTSRIATYQMEEFFMDPFISSQLDLPEKPKPLIKLNNFFSVIILQATLILISSLVLFFERFFHQISLSIKSLI